MEKGMETGHRMIMVIGFFISLGRRVGHRWTLGAWVFFGPSSDRCKYRIDDTWAPSQRKVGAYGCEGSTSKVHQDDPGCCWSAEERCLEQLGTDVETAAKRLALLLGGFVEYVLQHEVFLRSQEAVCHVWFARIGGQSFAHISCSPRHVLRVLFSNCNSGWPLIPWQQIAATSMPRFHIDHNHRQRLESPLQNQISVVVVIHNALDAVVEGHASQEFDKTVRFMISCVKCSNSFDTVKVLRDLQKCIIYGLSDSKHAFVVVPATPLSNCPSNKKINENHTVHILFVWGLHVNIRPADSCCNSYFHAAGKWAATTLWSRPHLYWLQRGGSWSLLFVRQSSLQNDDIRNIHLEPTSWSILAAAASMQNYSKTSSETFES